MGSPNNSGLSSGQQADSGMVGHRHGPPRDNTNFAGQDPNSVYHQVQAADPGQVGQVAQSWTNIGDALNTVNQVLSTGASAGAGGWSGAAADRALQFHTQVAQWTAVAAQGSYQAGGNVAQQSNAASTAKYTIPKPINYGVPQALADFAADPLSIGMIENKLSQAQANHQEISHVAQQYDTSLNQASQQMPALGPTPTFTNSSGGNVDRGATVRKSGSGSGSGSSQHAVDRLNSYRPGGGGQANPPRSGGGGQPVTSGPAPGSGQGTGLSGFGPGGGGGAGPGGGGRWPGNGPANGPGGAPGGGMMPMGPGGFGPGGSADGFGGAGRGGSGSGGRAGGFGIGGRGDGFGNPGRSGGFGPDGSGGAGARSAAGALSAAEEATATGAAGQPGAMGAGRGGRKGAEDQEHKRPSYLVEPDPDSIFGVDEMTAPPVIGG